ncbi:GntR family transcriptional regulator [Hyphomonas sp.]|jgi:GntR family transcriptional regulator of vanillate catabolism|uniref:GntR family transcriptional regulator n=1 Tax=Hyphomonas sp. TaxID=87 RepID=UPI0039E25D1C
MSLPPRSRQQLLAVLKLRELILSGEFSPGERVSELAVVDKLGISRTPVRLALTILEHEGFLKSYPGGGYSVREFSVRDVLDAIEIRGLLEGAAARLAAERHLSEDALAEIRKVSEELDAVTANPDSDTVMERYIVLNDRFHDLLLELGGSPMLRRSLAHVEALPFASPNAFVFLGVEASERFEILKYGQHQHAAILEAIELGEGARAEALAREHARLARRNLATAHTRMDLAGRVPGAALLKS